MKSWKTSLAGLLGGLILTFGPSVGARLSGDKTAPPITSGNYGVGIAIAALGLLAKDHDVTGGPDSGTPTAVTPNFPTTR